MSDCVAPVVSSDAVADMRCSKHVHEQLQQSTTELYTKTANARFVNFASAAHGFLFRHDHIPHPVKLVFLPLMFYLD